VLKSGGKSCIVGDDPSGRLCLLGIGTGDQENLSVLIEVANQRNDGVGLQVVGEGLLDDIAKELSASLAATKGLSLEYLCPVQRNLCWQSRLNKSPQQSFRWSDSWPWYERHFWNT
jgi:hypothetical protein